MRLPAPFAADSHRPTMISTLATWVISLSDVRRLLVEAAWHHRKPYRPTAVRRRRWQLASPAAVARAQAGNHRLHQRWVGYADRKKRPVIANVAVARELAGWCWSLAMIPD